MPREVDPYEVLGVPRGADLAQVRLAYRRAALGCHPDSYRGDPAEAQRRLCALIAAYKAIARSLDAAAWKAPSPADGRAFTPQDFARKGHGSFGLHGQESRPTRNETRTFAALWVAAVVLGVVVGCAAAWVRAHAAGPEGLRTRDIVLSVLYGELIYGALSVAAVLLVILTRRIVRLTIELAAQRWHFLPRPRPDRDLPPGSALAEPPQQGGRDSPA